MNNFPDKTELEALRAQYPPGTRVELTAPMDDPYAKLAPGDRATVTGVDGAGDLLCRWDSGSGLKLILGVDEFKVLGGGSGPMTDKVFSQVLARYGCTFTITIGVLETEAEAYARQRAAVLQTAQALLARLQNGKPNAARASWNKVAKLMEVNRMLALALSALNGAA